MKSSATSASVILDCLGIFALLAAAAVFAWSAWATLGLRSQIAAADAQARAAADKAATLNLEEQAVEQTSDARQALQTLAIPAGGDAGFISTIESLGSGAGVTVSISSVSAQAPVGTVDPGSLALTATVSGTYAACLHFLQLVETEHAALSIPSVSLSYSAADRQWSGTIVLGALSFDSP